MSHELARLYRQDADDLIRDWRRREEHLHTDALPRAARLCLIRSLRVLLWMRLEMLSCG